MLSAMRKEITPEQARYLELIRGFARRMGRPPSRREVADVCGFRSTNAATHVVLRLERAGLLMRDDRGGILLGSLLRDSPAVRDLSL
jgi:SOS-response transcriptional repressor LexA